MVTIARNRTTTSGALERTGMWDTHVLYVYSVHVYVCRVPCMYMYVYVIQCWPGQRNQCSNRINARGLAFHSSSITSFSHFSLIRCFFFYLKVISSQSYRNPFDIPRGSLLEQIARMRTNFSNTSANFPNLIEEGKIKAGKIRGGSDRASGR